MRGIKRVFRKIGSCIESSEECVILVNSRRICVEGIGRVVSEMGGAL